MKGTLNKTEKSRKATEKNIKTVKMYLPNMNYLSNKTYRL